MSIKELNFKIVGSLVVFWVLVFLLGYFLLTSGGMGLGGGNGNGSGSGNGTGGAGEGTGTGMTAEQTEDGTGAGWSGETFAGGAPESAEMGELPQESASEEDGIPQNPPETNAETAAEEPLDESSSAGAQAGIQAAQKELQKAQKHSEPELYGEKAKDSSADNSPQSKVIGLDEAKKGFFGVETSGRSTTLFLLDISGSMDSPTSERYSRLELLKRILIAELDRLHRAASQNELQTQVGSFVLATFSDDLRVFPQNRTFSYGSTNDILAAKRIIANISTDGGTSMMAAWRNLAPSLARNRWCDVVFFLSDGDPTDCQEAELVNFLAMNLRNLPINTFSLGTHSSMMENIARNHRGKYREIR